MLWNVLLLLILAIAIGVAFSIDGSWTERLLLASVFCGVIVYGFHRLTGAGFLGP